MKLENINMKPRKILYICRVVDGGVPVVVDQLARNLNREQYETIVLFDTNRQSHIRQAMVESDIRTIGLTRLSVEHSTRSPEPCESREITTCLEAVFGKRTRNIYLFFKSFYQFLRYDVPKIRSFIRVIRENGIDLVHTHSDLNSGKPEIVAAWITGIPCISHNHTFNKLTYFDILFSHFVDCFIYISSEVAKHHIAQGKPRHKGTVIHNGVDIGRFRQSYDPETVRQEFNINPGESLVGIVGRIDYWKGHEFFLEAMAEVSRLTCGWVKGMIIGDFEKSAHFHRNPQYFKRLLSLTKSLGLESEIIFTEFRSDVPRLIAALNIVVHASSLPEPFGLVVIEGMAAGKPVIATAAGGILDIIQDGVNGVLVPCKDSKAIAKAILQILSDPNSAKQMGLAARERVTEKYSIRNFLAAVQKLYQSRLDGSSQRV
jgi:glycosyltransferase involved in cell wall biosynthesis